MPRGHKRGGGWIQKAGGLALLVLALNAAAMPPMHRPGDDAQVLLRTERRDTSTALDAARSAWRAAPQDAQAAAHWAQAAIEQGRAESDPRWFGYAQAALAPWQAQAAPPPRLWLLRATLAQQRHDFTAALADLDALLAAHPGDAQAHLTRAVVHLVQGRPHAALADCAALLMRASSLTALACAADARSRMGQAGPAQAALTQLLQSPQGQAASGAEKSWALTLAAELAARLESPDAPAAFAAALAAGPDAYLSSAHADWLLAQDRAAEVLTLYGQERRDDNLLLRIALAQQALGDAALAQTRETLRARFSTARLRGERIHQREEALFLLRLEQDPAAALQAAQDNWASQREPLDARLLLEASLAAQQRAAAQPVLDWMKETGIEDPALLRLKAQLEQAP